MRIVDVVMQPKLYAKELLDIVASHVGLREKDYFGLSFLDERYCLLDCGIAHLLSQIIRICVNDYEP